jgi:hypothetical protein|tara:strand:+ start:238 stop:1098 length:861 start_codon:yes stop_codon:yes gene_type:complete
MKLSEYKLLGIVMILVAVVYFMNRNIKYLKNKVSDLETKMMEDKGDNLRAIKNVENEVSSKRITNNNNELHKKVVLLENKCKDLEQYSILNEKWKNKLDEQNKKIEKEEIKKISKNLQDNKIINQSNNEQYDMSDSDSELEVLSENIAIYSNDNEDMNISNSDIEDMSLGITSNGNDQNENSDSMVPNVVDSKILEGEISNVNSSPKIDVDIIEENLSHENEKKSEEDLQLQDLLKLKLNRLQCMAEEDGIDVIKDDGKKKTKKDLAEEILSKKLNSNLKKNTSSV